DFGGLLQSQTFCAHPKIDPVTGNMCAFGYATKGLFTRDMAYFEISPQGELVREIAFENRYYAMMHDFAITEDYAVFHVIPQTGSWERLRAGLPHFGWDPSLPVYLGVLRRDGNGRDIRWFRTPTVFASHVMNAFNEGTKVHFDTPVAKGNCFPFFPDVNGAPFDPLAARPYLTRWTVDLASNGEDFEKIEQLSGMIDEFPRIDDRYTGRPYRHGWMLVMDPEMPFNGPSGRASGFIMNRLAHVDLGTGEQTSWWAGPDTIVQEPCFIPRGKHAPEGDGYVVALADNLVTNYSDLVVLDAQRVDEGPIARAKLPVRLRSGLHGNWADESKLAMAA
ncbi:MAG: carotenoid oxygenase family protein, partial [Sphingomonadales bacterium]